MDKEEVSVFDWDEGNVRHIARHEITPDEAEEVLMNDPQYLSTQDDQGEERILEVGLTRAGRCLVILSTMRGERLRVVTAYDAPRALKMHYMISRGRVQ
jgi:uncharacterized DUF497 family protein